MTTAVLGSVNLQEAVVELIRRCSCEIPEDVRDAVVRARDHEEEGSAARNALDTIVQNFGVGAEFNAPLCQDTGAPIFWVHYPRGVDQIDIERDIRDAMVVATEKTFLRPNSVNSLTDENSGDNTGIGYPIIHCHQWEQDHIEIGLMLKGGGCENTSTQYKLPDIGLDAGRDLEGVRRCVIDAVYKAQGKGCSPGVMGVCIGGTRDSGYFAAKEALWRKLDEPNPEPELNELEKRLMDECNQLGIGPMGFGGKTTVIGIRITHQHRIPASYYVSISYMCWALRRHKLIIDGGEVSYD
jgi:fumarate hydratase class I